MGCQRFFTYRLLSIDCLKYGFFGRVIVYNVMAITMCNQISQGNKDNSTLEQCIATHKSIHESPLCWES